jgi:hypothetical protein
MSMMWLTSAYLPAAEKLTAATGAPRLSLVENSAKPVERKFRLSGSPLLDVVPPDPAGGDGVIYRTFGPLFAGSDELELLYLGSTSADRCRTRMREHEDRSTWSGLVSHVFFELRENREQAAADEDTLLRSGRGGLFNHEHTTKPRKQRRERVVPSQEELQRHVDELADAELVGLGRRFVDRRGEVYGRLTVLALHPEQVRGQNARWICRCDCTGALVVVTSNNLKTGNTTSCGCVRTETGVQRGRNSATHGLWRDYPILYSRYRSIKYRIKAMSRYKGIELRGGWQNIENFVRDLRPAEGVDIDPALDIDRIDPKGHYEPSNVRLIDVRGNQNNRENTRNAEVPSLATWLSFTDAAPVLGVSYSKLKGRADRGKLTPLYGGDLVRQAATRELRESRSLSYADTNDDLGFATWFNNWRRANSVYRIDTGKSSRKKPNASRTPSETMLRFIATRAPLYLRAVAKAKRAAANSNTAAADQRAA